MMERKVIGLVDCNAFYCSCEQLFRPELKNKAVVVLSNNDGCAISRTPEAKALGIKMGQPFFEFKHLLQHKKLTVFSANFKLYTNISQRVMQLLKELAPKTHVYSIDEAFIDLTGIKNVHQFGVLLRREIYRQIGIPVGVGISYSLVLAKLANQLAKNHTNSVVCLLSDDEIELALKNFPIQDVWGIGRANHLKMKALNIHSALGLKNYPSEKIIQKYFSKLGVQIKQELSGINCISINQNILVKKQIMTSRSFAKPVTSKNELKKLLADFITLACEKLRTQASLCQTISIFARSNQFDFNQFKVISKQINLTNPTNDTLALIKLSETMLDEIYIDGVHYKKAGVCLSDFYQNSEYQLDLFQLHQVKDNKKLMQIMDKINQKNGHTVLKSMACSLKEKDHYIQQNFKSPSYTHDWQQLKKFG
jgi:DNA polymerase V